MPRTKTVIKRQQRQRGRGLDIQNLLSKTGIECHVPGYQYLGSGTKLKKRLAWGDPGKNQLDRIAKQHDIDYSVARNRRNKWKADDKMIKAINNLPGRKTMTERAIRKVMQTKKKLKLQNYAYVNNKVFETICLSRSSFCLI